MYKYSRVCSYACKEMQPRHADRAKRTDSTVGAYASEPRIQIESYKFISVSTPEQAHTEYTIRPPAIQIICKNVGSRLVGG